MAERKFDGFGEKALPFLKALGFHQDRQWFQENKDLYESQLRLPLIALVEDASNELPKAGIPLHGTRKSSLFRINRDIRFTKEKHPYNTHVSAVLTRNGTKKDTGGIYLHIAAGDCYFASGLWMPEGPQLKAMREQIIARRSEFEAIIETLAAQDLHIGSESMITRPPAGFKQWTDDPIMFWLRHKSFVTSRKFNDERIQSPALLDDMIEFGQQIMPLMSFIWRAVDPLREDPTTE